jgi:hypothetical protein
LRTPPVLPALLAALLAGACASSAWQRTEGVPGGKLYVPKVYAPLLPGSIYPDRKHPVPAKGRPAIVVVCPGTGDCRRDEILESAGRRGMVVLVLEQPPSAPLNSDLLRTRAEANAAQTGWLLVEPTGAFLRRWMEDAAPGTSAALLRPPPLPSSPSKRFFLLLSSLHPTEGDSFPSGAILKLYAARPSGGLPPQAFRDAVEWLAAALELR